MGILMAELEALAGAAEEGSWSSSVDVAYQNLDLLPPHLFTLPATRSAAAFHPRFLLLPRPDSS